MLSLRQLQYLVTVVDEGSFTRAAEALHVTQPALSHQIRALERAAGAPLLERLPRAVGLTPAGRAMLPHARAALSDAERAESAVRQAAASPRGNCASRRSTRSASACCLPRCAPGAGGTRGSTSGCSSTGTPPNWPRR
ncbi:LysR family transcriptional regulator [Actinomadura madurae]|uniref:LysR family transcriptional regulator n=1 Tax=Actinomadura madurae TaxID=1993 RepID=UPI0020D23D17|nr:LysR family transcriptional regulator [Actinomadura madurae]MCP9969357.1 LysR family transcriptional regulator [Actinomadura madurae]MCQ0006656.1 LysR family transcriptional regulator [Actinomadura madurae]